LLTLKEKRWLRALEIAKCLFEDEGYHTKFLEEIEEFIKTHQEGNQQKGEKS